MTGLIIVEGVLVGLWVVGIMYVVLRAWDRRHGR